MIKKLGVENVDEMYFIETQCFGDEAWTVSMLISEISNPFSYVYGRFDDGTLAGYCSLRIIGDEGHINNIAVLPSFRRKSYAASLLSHMLEKGGEAGATDFTLEVRVENSAAISLYRGFGFKAVGIRPDYYGKGENALIMWKRDGGQERKRAAVPKSIE